MWARLLQTVLLGFVSASGFFLGSCFQSGVRASLAPYKELETFAKVLQYIDQHFVEEVSASQLIKGAIKGMLRTLDPHSAYLEPKLYKEFKEETSGHFGGLGIEVTIFKKVLTVVAPIEDSPAFKAGMKSGDIIVKVGDKSTKEISLPEAVTLMKGEPGTTVEVTVKRGTELKTFKIKREVVNLRSVKSAEYKKDTGYMRISSFTEKTASELESSLNRLIKNKNIKGLVLDLRGNPGGLLDQAVRVSNFFLDEGPIVYTIGRNKEEKSIEYAQKGQKITDLPLVVLMDGASASASEIVAGALKDHGRAVVAGQKSFGKGSVQTIVPLGRESGLKLTIARYYTPSGASIQARGIEPDVPLDYIDEETLKKIKASSRQVRESDLLRHFESDEKSKKDQKTPVLLSHLQKKLESDYMLAQARGIIKTLSLADRKLKKPEFKIDLDEKKASKK